MFFMNTVTVVSEYVWGWGGGVAIIAKLVFLRKHTGLSF